ncbi:MAG: gamma carbonic anhydrase family protein, partial [Gammaproteobacteria bacterium]|nr:gamma carbonic anhydrase family protein [Gammaproteobacteria bacterium]
HKSHYNPSGYPLILGDDITVGHKVILHACEIRDHCLIGMGAIVMDGTVVEPRTILAAGSLVPGGKVIEGNSLWRGAPARRVRALTDKEIEAFDYSAGNYVKLAREYLL